MSQTCLFFYILYNLYFTKLKGHFFHCLNRNARGKRMLVEREVGYI